jgi:hypothetical protein
MCVISNSPCGVRYLSGGGSCAIAVKVVRKNIKKMYRYFIVAIFLQK